MRMKREISRGEGTKVKYLASNEQLRPREERRKVRQFYRASCNFSIYLGFEEEKRGREVSKD